MNGGTVIFTVAGIIGSATSGTVANGAASASFTVPGGTAAGGYAITATYNPGTGCLGSSDSSHTLTVQQPVPPTIVSFSIDFGSESYNLTTGSRTTHLPWTVTGVTVVFSRPLLRRTRPASRALQQPAYPGSARPP